MQVASKGHTKSFIPWVLTKLIAFGVDMNLPIPTLGGLTGTHLTLQAVCKDKRSPTPMILLGIECVALPQFLIAFDSVYII